MTQLAEAEKSISPRAAMIERPSARPSAVTVGKGAPPVANVPGSGPTEVHAEVDAETHILTIHDFKLHYGKRQALYGVNMKIAAGKVTALIGPSGCGKSTLLRSINRLNDLVDGVRIEGDMRFKGESIYQDNIDVIDLRKRLGMVFQKSNPFPMSIFRKRSAGGPSRGGTSRRPRASTIARGAPPRG